MATTKTFQRKDGSICAVIADALVVLPSTGYAHVAFMRSDRTLGRLCDTKKVLSQRDGWRVVTGDVLTIPALESNAGRVFSIAGESDSTFEVPDIPRMLGDHYLCRRCESSLNQLDRTTPCSPDANKAGFGSVCLRMAKTRKKSGFMGYTAVQILSGCCTMRLLYGC